MARIPTQEEKAQRRLAILVEGYLGGEAWAKERVVQEEVGRLGPSVLERVLNSAQFSYLNSINPPKLDQVRKRFLKRQVDLRFGRSSPK